MDSAVGLRPSPLDHLATLLMCRALPTDEQGDHRHLLVLLATSLAVIVGCSVALIVRRSSVPQAQVVKTPHVAAKKPREEEPDPDDGHQQVALFFGTQTGTAKGFAKALAEEAKARYDMAVFKVFDLDNYAAEDEEYREKLKKENIALFFLAM